MKPISLEIQIGIKSPPPPSQVSQYEIFTTRTPPQTPHVIYRKLKNTVFCTLSKFETTLFISMIVIKGTGY